MKTYQEYYNEWQNSTESRDLSFEEWLMLLLDRKEKEMIDKNYTQGGLTIDSCKDVKVLLDIADDILEKLSKKKLLQMDETDYYISVLEAYGEYKKLGIIKGTELELELEKYRQRENEVY